MDVKDLFEYHNPPSPYPQLDTILDDHKQATANVDRTIEERIVDNLQVGHPSSVKVVLIRL